MRGLQLVLTLTFVLLPHAAAAETSVVVGGGGVFWGQARRGGGLNIGWCPLMLEIEYESDEVAFALGTHFVWAGGTEFDFGLHPSVAKEWQIGKDSAFSLGSAFALSLEHEPGGWQFGLGAGPTMHLKLGHTLIGLDIFMLGVTDGESWRPGWEGGLFAGYAF